MPIISALLAPLARRWHFQRKRRVYSGDNLFSNETAAELRGRSIFALCRIPRVESHRYYSESSIVPRRARDRNANVRDLFLSFGAIACLLGSVFPRALQFYASVSTWTNELSAPTDCRGADLALLTRSANCFASVISRWPPSIMLPEPINRETRIKSQHAETKNVRYNVILINYTRRSFTPPWSRTPSSDMYEKLERKVALACTPFKSDRRRAVAAIAIRGTNSAITWRSAITCIVVDRTIRD